MKVKCSCGYECPIEFSDSSYNVGERQRQTGMKAVFLSDGESTWVCQSCFLELVQIVRRANAIVGSEHWSPYVVAKKVEVAEKKTKACGCEGECPAVAHCRTCKKPTFMMVDACVFCTGKSLGGREISREEALRGLGDQETWPEEQAKTMAEFRKKPEQEKE